MRFRLPLSSDRNWIMDYKEIKEKFVSGHEGTSLLEIAVVVSVAPLSVLLRNMLLSWLYRGQAPHPM